MILYDMIKAPNPRRVRMFVAEKSSEIFAQLERREIDIPGGANLTPQFLAINPRGVVPTLVLDDGTVIDESIAICRYFEEIYPEPNLMGSTPVEKALIESAQRQMELEGLYAIAAVFRNSAPQFADRALPGTSPSFAQSIDYVERGTAQTQHYFAALNQRLKDRSFIAGDRFTIADITAFIAVGFARWVKLGPAPDHENTHRWLAQVKQRPSALA
jgi:glutathione S-transferase